MPKAQTSYLGELAAWVQAQPPKKHGQDANAVAFLAVRDDVEAALAAGFPLTTIWRHLHETQRLGFRYDTFLRYVRKHVRRYAPVAPAQSHSTPSPSPAPGSSVPPQVEPRDFAARPCGEPYIGHRTKVLVSNTKVWVCYLTKEQEEVEVDLAKITVRLVNVHEG